MAAGPVYQEHRFLEIVKRDACSEQHSRQLVRRGNHLIRSARPTRKGRLMPSLYVSSMWCSTKGMRNCGRPLVLRDSEAIRLAPHPGHVSNFCGIKAGALEPLQLVVTKRHPHKTGPPIQTGRPAKMSLEPREDQHPPDDNRRIGVGTVKATAFARTNFAELVL